MELGVVISLLVLAFFVWGVPIVFVATDPSIGNKEKAIWVFAIGVGSWFAWFLYRFVAPILERPKIYDFEDQETRRRAPPAL